MKKILVGFADEAPAHRQPPGQRLDERLGLRGAEAIVHGCVRDPALVLPDRPAVRTPVAAQGPARQGLARVPFALPMVQEALRRPAAAQPFDQRFGQLPLFAPQGGGVPLLAVHVVDGDEGGLAAHRQAHVGRLEFAIDPLPQLLDRRPDLFRIGPRGARRFADAPDGHPVAEIDLAGVQRSADRGRSLGLRRTGQRDVPFARPKPGGGIQAHPSGSGKIGLGPGMQIGEIRFRSRRAVQGPDVGRQLNQVSGDKARGKAQVAQDVDQQPGGIAAGAAAQREGLLAGLHVGLHPDEVADVPAQLPVQLHEKTDDWPRAAVDPGETGAESFERRLPGQVGPQIRGELRLVCERKQFGLGLQKEIKRIDDDHLGHQVHLHLELGGLFREHQAPQVVAERVLLPVDEMLLRRHGQRVAQNRGPAMRRRPQPNGLGPEGHPAVVAIRGRVVQGGMYSHLWSFPRWIGPDRSGQRRNPPPARAL